MEPRLKSHIASAMKWMEHRAAARYVAGPELEDAIAECRELGELGWRVTVCLWDTTLDSSSRVLAQYMEILRRLREERLDGNLSVKYPSIGYDEGALGALLSKAREQSCRVCLDSQDPDSVDRILASITRLRVSFSNISMAIPSRWKRSVGDLERAIELGLRIRLVKGQWRDVRGGEVDPREGYLRLAERLADSECAASIATHDTGLQPQVMKLFMRTSGKRVEIEQLYHLPLSEEIFNYGVPLRMYVPYGRGYLPYDVYEMKRRPSIGVRLMNDLATGIALRMRGRTYLEA